MLNVENKVYTTEIYDLIDCIDITVVTSNFVEKVFQNMPKLIHIVICFYVIKRVLIVLHEVVDYGVHNMDN